MRLNKTDIVERLARRAEVTQEVAGKVFDEFVGLVVDEVSKGNEVRVHGLGIFSRRFRKAKSGTAPNGTSWTKDAGWNVAFRAAQAFKDAVDAVDVTAVRVKK